MKLKTTFLVLIALLILQVQCIAQNLSLTQLIAFVKADADDINTKLAALNWRQLGATKEDKELIVTWGYGFIKHDSTAAAWLSIYGNPETYNRVVYQTPSPVTYSRIVNEILAFKPQKGEAFMSPDGAIERTYYGKNYLYKTSTNDGTNTIIVSDRESQFVRDLEKIKSIGAIDTFQLELLYETKLKKGLIKAPMYEGEGIDFDMIYQIKPTDVLQVHNRGNKFYWITINELIGYVSKESLQDL